MSNLDSDLMWMGIEQLQRTASEMRDDIRYVVTQEQDDLCWRDAYLKLAGHLPEKPQVDHTPPTPIFLANCRRFELSMRTGTKYRALECPLGHDNCTGLRPRSNHLAVFYWGIIVGGVSAIICYRALMLLLGMFR